MLISYTLISFNNEGVFMGPTQGPHILQLYMGRSYFWRGLTPPDFLISHAASLCCCQTVFSVNDNLV